MTTPILDIAELSANQSQPEIIVNEALRTLEVVPQLRVLDRDLSAPPASPAADARYIVGASASGAWATQDGKVAFLLGGTWTFLTPETGWRAFVVDENSFVQWDGDTWALDSNGPALSVADTASPTTEVTDVTQIQVANATVEEVSAGVVKITVPTSGSGALSVADTASPTTEVTDVTQIQVANATVEEVSAGVVLVTPTGGAALTVSDAGSPTVDVPNVTQLWFAGGYVEDLGGGQVRFTATSVGSSGGGSSVASQVTFANATSGLTASDVQAAIDEVVGKTLYAEIIADAPTAYWKCDETTGTTIADSSGGAHDLTITGTVTLADNYLIKKDTAKYMTIAAGASGAQATTNLGLSPPLANDWTIECVVQLTVIGTNSYRLLSMSAAGETEAANYQIYANVGTDGILHAFWEYSAGTNMDVSSTITLQPGCTYHLAFVKNTTAKTITFYVSGRKVWTASYTNEPTGGTSGMITAIGVDSTPGSTNQMTIGHVAFYNGTQLSHTRIRAHAIAAGLM